MATTIATILKIKDLMSSPLKKISVNVVKVKDNITSLSKTEQQAARHAANYINQHATSYAKACNSITKWTGRVAIGLTGLALKQGLSEAMDLETYRTQLETATKDTVKAARVMEYAINLANITPFEGGELVGASAALENARLSAEEYLTLLGDTAAGSNRTIAEIQRGFIDAFTVGDFQSFRDTIGITKKTVQDFAKENGIKDMTVALKEFLQQRFGGGMEKLSKTAKGAWSTITGATKSILANIVGINKKGELVAGGLLSRIAEKLNSIGSKIEDIQNNSDFTKFSQMLGKIFDFLAGIFGIFMKYPIIVGIVLGLVFATSAYLKIMALVKAVQEVSAIIETYRAGVLAISTKNTILATIAQWGLNAAMYAFPIFLIIGAIIMLIALLAKLAKGFGGASKAASSFKGPGITNTDYMADIEKAKAYLPQNALGTNYFSGGRTLVGERGAEIVDLPSGSKITSAFRSAGSAGKSIVNHINIVINGAQKSDDELADLVARRIRGAMANC